MGPASHTIPIRIPKDDECTRMSMALSNYLVSWVVTYIGEKPTYIGVIIYLLHTMDIPVVSTFHSRTNQKNNKVYMFVSIN